MELKDYVISLISAAVIAGILLNLIKTNSTYGVLIKLLVGLFIALTVISPWKTFRFSDILYYFDDWEAASAVHSNYGADAYNEALRTSIIDRTQAYILEKASSVGAELTATVTVSGDQPPVPVAVELEGNISPYNKRWLTETIVNDLGIPEEAQRWK